MFGMPIVVAALALMGAPANTPVDCAPVGLNYALSWHAQGTRIVTRTDYSPTVCAGLLYLSASAQERAKLRTLNPTVDFPRDEGVALLTVLHESHHATGDFDETTTECAAMQALPAFITRWVTEDERETVMTWARVTNALLPAEYHRHAC